MTFTPFDFFTFAVIAFSTLLGIYKGSINILVNFLGFLASIALAIYIYPYVKIVFMGYIANETIYTLVSGGASYILSLVFCSFVTSKILKSIDENTGGFLDRLVGGLLGFARGIIFLLVIFAVMFFVSDADSYKAKNKKTIIDKIERENFPEFVRDTVSADYYGDAMKYALKMLPADLLRDIQSHFIDSDDDEDDDLIDKINKKKQNESGVKSSLEEQDVGDLDEKIKEIQ